MASPSEKESSALRKDVIEGIEFIDYVDESQIDSVMSLVGRDLSEPYSISTDNPDEPIACVVGKIDEEEVLVHGSPQTFRTGYIGMLAVHASHRRKGIGTSLVRQVLRRMKDSHGCTSVTLETEVSNKAAQKLYEETFGFVREELLVRYYLNWGDAYRLRLWYK